jgi:hypothetical protein
VTTRSAIVFLAAYSLSVHALRAAVVFDNGAPDHLDGYEFTHWIDANQFSLSAAQVITGIHLWEAEASNSFYGAILWEIRANTANNTPGAVLFSGTSTNLLRTATGLVVHGFLPEYDITFDIASSASLPAGTYWLTLHNGPLSNNTGRDIFWETTVNGNLASSLSDEAPFDGIWDNNSSLDDPNSQLAFQLIGVPAAWAPKMTSITRVSGSTKLIFTTAANHTYRVDYKDLMTDSPWLTLSNGNNIAGNGGAVTIFDATNLTHRFYRVVLVQ